MAQPGDERLCVIPGNVNCRAPFVLVRISFAGSGCRAHDCSPLSFGYLAPAHPEAVRERYAVLGFLVVGIGILLTSVLAHQESARPNRHHLQRHFARKCDRVGLRGAVRRGMMVTTSSSVGPGRRSKRRKGTSCDQNAIDSKPNISEEPRIAPRCGCPVPHCLFTPCLISRSKQPPEDSLKVVHVPGLGGASRRGSATAFQSRRGVGRRNHNRLAKTRPRNRPP